MTHDHARADAERLTFADVFRFSLVGLRGSSHVHAFLTGAANRLGIPLRCRLLVDSFELAARAIAERIATGVLPRGAVEPMRERLGLRFVPLDETWARRTMVLCYKDSRMLTAPARRLAMALELSAKDRGGSRRQGHRPLTWPPWRCTGPLATSCGPAGQPLRGRPGRAVGV